jgi:hypothetical protein
MILLIRTNLYFQITSSLLRWLQGLTNLLVTHTWLPTTCVTSVSFFRIIIWARHVHLLITQLTLSDNHRCLTLLIWWSNSILLCFNLKITHLAVWVICIWIQVEFCSLVFWVNFCSVFERLQNLTCRLTMLVFVCVWRLNIHPIFLGLKLF